ncbi:hypothetical protein PIB30_096570, partial [Stylosanthes scabra]|nr:hypothetical protein [Stylosanthes scabra]
STVSDEQRSPYVEKKRSGLKISRNPQQLFKKGARDLKEKLGIGGSFAIVVKEGRRQVEVADGGGAKRSELSKSKNR